MAPRVIEHSTEIGSPPGAVWAVLRDVAAYGEWNPFMRIERFPDRVGDRLSVNLHAGKRTMSLSPVVTRLEEGHALCWSGRLLLPRLFDGAHELHVEPVDGGRSRFVHRETFRGLLVPFLPGVLRDTDAAFAAMNDALRTRVAAVAGRSPVSQA